MMSDDPELKRIHDFIDNGDYASALKLCDKLISEYPDAWGAYREKADILAFQKKDKEALSILEKLAEIGTEEPSDYYDLALGYLKFKKYLESARASDMGIMLCRKHDHYYYYKSCCLIKAFSLLMLKEYKEALEACGEVDGDYSEYVSKVGMVSQKDIVKQAIRGLNSELPE